MADNNQPETPDNNKEEASSPKCSRLGATWLILTAFVLLLILLIVFMIQNSQSVHIHYLGASGRLPLSIAMLISAVVGAFLAILIGSARIIQLKYRLHRQ